MDNRVIQTWKEEVWKPYVEKFVDSVQFMGTRII